MLLVMALLAAQATTEASVKPIPRGDAPWITNDDYPVEEARAHHEGVVGFALQVDVLGHAVKCDVTATSGYVGLDKQTCFLMMRRARFNPALENGRALDSRVTGNFTWRLGNAPPYRNGVDGGVGVAAPVPPGALQLTVERLPSDYRQPARASVSFGTDQRVVDCRVLESSGNSAIDRAACGQLRALATAPSLKAGAAAAKTAEYIVSFRADTPAKP
ncbi:energy transducer TonB [Sphingomonas elodea]|uniref:energy transducer TonB n=1 Tax=Sphingomonas elodea TaxID=179878 RepID=UPI0002630293|nr:energy transducer TonB [Sphingomonas elodea]